MTDEPEVWSPRCVLCAARGRERRLDHGHCCPACKVRIDDDLAAIVRLAVEAATRVEFSSGTGAGVRTAPSSRPPINVEALDPEFTEVILDPSWTRDDGNNDTVLGVLENLAREVREARQLAAYGPATEHDDLEPRTALTNVVRFLRAHLDWITTTTDIGLEEFAWLIGQCRKALGRYDTERDPQQARFQCACPTSTDVVDETTGLAVPCGCRLTIERDQSRVSCPRCRVDRTVDQLLRITGDDAYADAESIASRLPITARTVRRWAQAGKVARSGGLYRFGDVRRLVRDTPDEGCA